MAQADELETERQVREAISAVLACADRMEEGAARLLEALPELPMEEELRAAADRLREGLKDSAGRVMFELALLRARLDEGRADVATVVHKLAGLDAAMMSALVPLADLADELETAAEQDEEQEPAFVLVIETAGAMLQSLDEARSATQALQALCADVAPGRMT